MSGLEISEPTVTGAGGEGTKAPEGQVVPKPELIARREAAFKILRELDEEAQVAVSEINSDAFDVYTQAQTLPVNPARSDKPYETEITREGKAVRVMASGYEDFRQGYLIGADSRAEITTSERGTRYEAQNPNDTEVVTDLVTDLISRVSQRSISIKDPGDPRFELWFDDLSGGPKDWHMPTEFSVTGPNGFVTVARKSPKGGITVEPNQRDTDMPELKEPLDIARRILDFANGAALQPAEAATPVPNAPEPTPQSATPSPTTPVV